MPSSNKTYSFHLRATDLLRLSLRVFRTRPLRSFLTILGISLGIGAVLFLVALGYGLQEILLGRLASTEDSLVTLEAFYPPETGLTMGPADVEKFSGLENVAEASAVAEFMGEIKTAEDAPPGFLTIRLVQPNYYRLAGIAPDIGRAPKARAKEAVISSAALKLVGLPVDQSVIGKEITGQVFYQNPNEPDIRIQYLGEPFRVEGIISDEVQPPFVILPAEMMQEQPPFFIKTYLKAKGLESVESLREALIKEGMLISARIDLIRQAQQIMTVITVVLGIFGVTALVVSAIGMFNTMVIGFLERSFEVGIMKSLGATNGDIRKLFLGESLIMGLCGGVGGVLMGMGSGWLFNTGLNLLARHLGGKPIDLFVYPPQFLALIIGISVLVGVFAGIWPARRAAQLSPKEAFTRK